MRGCLRERGAVYAHENIYIEAASGVPSPTATPLVCSGPTFSLYPPSVHLQPPYHHPLRTSSSASTSSYEPPSLLCPFIPDKRRQPPTDSSANSVSELQDFSSSFPLSFSLRIRLPVSRALPTAPLRSALLLLPSRYAERCGADRARTYAESAVVTYVVLRRRQTESDGGTNIVARQRDLDETATDVCGAGNPSRRRRKLVRACDSDVPPCDGPLDNSSVRGSNCCQATGYFYFTVWT